VIVRLFLKWVELRWNNSIINLCRIKSWSFHLKLPLHGNKWTRTDEWAGTTLRSWALLSPKINRPIFGLTGSCRTNQSNRGLLRINWKMVWISLQIGLPVGLCRTNRILILLAFSFPPRTNKHVRRGLEIHQALRPASFHNLDVSREDNISRLNNNHCIVNLALIFAHLVRIWARKPCEILGFVWLWKNAPLWFSVYWWRW
jgi:hypothetical protein